MSLRFKSIVCDVYYLLFFALSSPVWIFRLLTRPSWREGFGQRLGFVRIPPPQRPRVWVHGVSVGEVLSAKGLVSGLSGKPGIEVAVSTTTRTGQAVARRTFPSHPVFHYPLDFSFSVSRSLRRVSPSLIILVELEVWPNFLLHAAMRGVPVAFVNCRITRRSFESYRFLAWILRPLFSGVDLFCVQNAEYAGRLYHSGARAESLVITGNIKYDNLPGSPDPSKTAALREDLGLKAGEVAIVAGSIHPGEDETVVRVFAELKRTRPDLRLILVPRHPEKFARAEEVAAAAGFRVFRRTAGRAPADPGLVILLDTMGELAAVYAAADLVFVGGSLVSHGGQNMMEPAGLGKAVVFGPSVHNFREDSAFLLEKGAAVQVQDEAGLELALASLADDPCRRREMGEKALKAVGSKRGATARTLAALDETYLNRLTAR